MRISDWSSDVCSSDLLKLDRLAYKVGLVLTIPQHRLYPNQCSVRKARHRLVRVNPRATYRSGFVRDHPVPRALLIPPIDAISDPTYYKIGRASCRERVCQYV